MASSLKRHLVRGAVSENVATMAGTAALKRAMFGARARAFVRPFLLSLVALSVLALSLSIGRLATEEPVMIPTAAPTLPGGQLLAQTVIAEFRSSAGDRFTLPTKIDRSVFRLPIRTVVIDPGHGGPSVGTTMGDLYEKEITLDVAERLRTLLNDAGFAVLMTRDSDLAVTLQERVELANQSQGDLFLSIHVNWLGKRARAGIETFYLGPTDDPHLVELASRENETSGYSLSDFRSLLEGVFADVRNDESQQFAKAIQSALVHSVKSIEPSVRDRGVKTAPFVVLIGTEMPAILAEVATLSSPDEAELLRRPLYRQYIAEALFDGIRRYLEARGQSAPRVASPVEPQAVVADAP